MTVGRSHPAHPPRVPRRSVDTATFDHAARARVTGFDPESALYDERSLVRMIGMRRILFVVPLDFAHRELREMSAARRRARNNAISPGQGVLTSTNC